MKLQCIVGAIFLGVSSLCYADGAAIVGIGAGRATIDVDDVDLSGHSTAWEAFAGWQFNRYVSVEAGYIDAGTAEDQIAGIRVRADATAIAASVVGSLPIGESFSLFGRAGYMHWESAESATDGTTTIAGDFDGDDPFFGAGMAVGVEGALLRLEYRMASLDDADLSLISLALAWRF